MNKNSQHRSGQNGMVISRNAHSMGLTTHCFSNSEPDYIHEEVDVFHNISIFEKDAIVDICRAERISGL